MIVQKSILLVETLTIHLESVCLLFNVMSATKYTPIWTLCLVVNYTSIAMIAVSKTYKCFYVLAPNLPDDLDPCGALNEDKYNVIIKIGAIFN